MVHYNKGDIVMKNTTVTVFGGTGFLGRHIIRLLAREGAFIKAAVRYPEEGRHLLPMGDVGQIKLERTNVRDDAAVARTIQGSDIVINLVGILYEKGKQTFKTLHIDAAKHIAEAAKKAGVRQLIHVSALGTHKDAQSKYGKSKAAGESAVLSAFPEALIIRPSVIFGPEDNFFNKLANLATFGGLALINGKTRFQPVYVDDVAQAIITICNNQCTGQVFELGGPKVYTFKELIDFVIKSIERPVTVYKWPNWLGYICGALMQLAPKPILTIDQVRLSKTDTVVSGKTKTFADLGITPQDLEGIVPRYLMQYKKQ